MNRIYLFAAMTMMCGCVRPGPPLLPVVTHDLPAEPNREVAPPRIAVAREMRTIPEPDGKLLEPIEAGMPPAPPNLERSITSINGRLLDVYFAYDHFEVAPQSIETLRQDAGWLHAILRDFPTLRISVEGHCDERGSAEYNLGLGDRRAMGAAKVLRDFGLPAESLIPVSYGKEAPQCAEASETCWSRNRRVHLVVRGS